MADSLFGGVATEYEPYPIVSPQENVSSVRQPEVTSGSTAENYELTSGTPEKNIIAGSETYVVDPFVEADVISASETDVVDPFPQAADLEHIGRNIVAKRDGKLTPAEAAANKARAHKANLGLAA